MVKQPPAALKSAVTTTSTSSNKLSSSSNSNQISSTNKTASLSTTASGKKKYGGSGTSPTSRSRSATKELILPPSDAASKPPKWEIGLKNLNIGDGERLTLQCQVSGDPEPQVSWYKNNKKLESNDYVDLKYKCGLATLKIEEVFPEDAGEYKCVAKNYINDAETNCTVKVLRKFSLSMHVISDKIFIEQNFNSQQWKEHIQRKGNRRLVMKPSLTKLQRSQNI